MENNNQGQLTEFESHLDMLTEKWSHVLDIEDAPKLNRYKRRDLAQILESTHIDNQNKKHQAAGSMLMETTPTNLTGSIDKYDPILISLLRRSIPNLLAYDVMGVQPMTGPTGKIFAFRSRYGAQNGNEAFYNEANTIFTGIVGLDPTTDTSTNPVANVANANAFSTGVAMPTATAEQLGNSGGTPIAEMGISIDSVTVTAKSRAIMANYSVEMAQDLYSIHGLNAEAELSNMLATEVLAEINREAIRTIYTVAKPGCQFATTTKGTFDLDTDSNGRHLIERFAGLIFQLKREANVIAKETRRGKGNILIVSSDVASALSMTKEFNWQAALQSDLEVDDTGNTFAGTFANQFKVYIDPYFGGYSNGYELACVGYKGGTPYDAGLFYAPYIPLQLYKAVDPANFQPRLAYKLRYGMVANPFAEGLTLGAGALNARKNVYYRIFSIRNLA